MVDQLPYSKHVLDLNNSLRCLFACFPCKYVFPLGIKLSVCSLLFFPVCLCVAMWPSGILTGHEGILKHSSLVWCKPIWFAFVAENYIHNCILFKHKVTLIHHMILCVHLKHYELFHIKYWLKEKSVKSMKKILKLIRKTFYMAMKYCYFLKIPLY